MSLLSKRVDSTIGPDLTIPVNDPQFWTHNPLCTTLGSIQSPVGLVKRLDPVYILTAISFFLLTITLGVTYV